MRWTRRRNRSDKKSLNDRRWSVKSLLQVRVTVVLMCVKQWKHTVHRGLCVSEGADTDMQAAHRADSRFFFLVFLSSRIIVHLTAAEIHSCHQKLALSQLVKTLLIMWVIIKIRLPVIWKLHFFKEIKRKKFSSERSEKKCKHNTGRGDTRLSQQKHSQWTDTDHSDRRAVTCYWHATCKHIRYLHSVFGFVCVHVCVCVCVCVCV